MRKYAGIVIALLLLVACGETVPKPEKLVEEEKMANILYDLYLLDGIRQSNPSSFVDRQLEPSDYILKKYGVDSLQFVQSDHWYAADTERYKNLYKKVMSKVQDAKKKNGPVATTPAVSGPTTDTEVERLRKLKRRARALNRASKIVQPAQ